MSLHVVDHHPAAWFLLRDATAGDDEFYLDVNCDAGAVGFSVLVKLSDAERAVYREIGRGFVESLAETIADRPNDYRDRDLTRSLGQEVHAAVMSFKRTTESNPEPGAR
jgi:hypothetical protein